jgi:TonB family protein
MRATFIRAAVFAGIALIGLHPVQAQGDPSSSLFSVLKGKKFALRSFSADPVVQYRWADGALTFDPPKVSTLAVFAPDSVKLKGTILTIAGKRFTLVTDEKSGKPAISGGSAAKLVIDLGSADPSLVMPKLQDALFCADLNAVIGLVPPQFDGLVPFRSDPSNPQHVSASPQARPFWYLEAGTWRNMPRDQLKIKQPQLLQTVEPEYSQDARANKIEGIVTFAFVVDESGKVKSPWLLQGLGHGLDEAAQEALLRYTFVPGQINGRRVGVVLVITVGFQTL